MAVYIMIINKQRVNSFVATSGTQESPRFFRIQQDYSGIINWFSFKEKSDVQLNLGFGGQIIKKTEISVKRFLAVYIAGNVLDPGL